MIGKRLAHYEIIEKLGAGGMGEVYRARDTKLAREVAIKVLPAEFAADPDRRKRFTREAQAIAALKHPNIVTIYSVEEADDVHFITMELVEGETLAQRIPSGGLPLDRFFDYSIALADAISSAHDEGITHRDLKPTNVMFDKGGRLKVLDFGLAKLLADNVDPEQAKTLAQGSDTAVGQILGTAAYMSPEQAEGEPIDHRSDIFSLGIMLFEMATGERPFQGKTHISTISSILKDKPASVSEIKQTLPRHLGRIVNRCLEKNVDKRFQTAKDVRNELEDLKKEVDTGEIAQTLTSASSLTTALTPSRPWLPWALLGVVVVAVAVALVFVMRPWGPPGDAEVSEVATTGEGFDVRVPGTTAAAEDDRDMVVILPFENLGPAEDAYFAAGMTEEITSRLAAVHDLGVISRTSAKQYDRTNKTIRQIGDDLGVDYVLEGSVRWAKRADGTGRVRITPQLIRVADDTHVWSERYDREINDIFEVQSDIAKRVIEQLGITLLGSEREVLADAPTENMEAYQLYLQARDLEAAGDMAGWDRLAVELLEGATRLDPKFVDAWAELSMHHSVYYNTFLDRTDERLSRARLALQRAEDIDANHFQTHLARGAYYYYGFREYDQALEEFLAATEIVPNEAEAREMVGYIYRRQGKWTEALEHMKAAFDLNPQENNIASNIADTYAAMREFEEALRYYDRAISLAPDNYEYVFDKAQVFVRWKGDLDTAFEIMSEKPEGNRTWYHFGNMFLNYWSRDYVKAREHALQWDTTNEFFRVAQMFSLSMFNAKEKGPEAARDELEEAHEAIQAFLKQAPGNDIVRSFLARVLALLGETEAAVNEAKLTADLVAKDRFQGPERLEEMAQVYAFVGRHDEAIDLLERLLKTVYSEAITPQMLAIDPLWDPLREHPRFQKLLPPKHI